MNRLLLLTFLLQRVWLAFGAKICPLCGDATKFPKRWDYIVETNPVKTCNTVYFEAAFLSPEDEDCAPLVEKYGATCCDDEEPDPIYIPPTSAPNWIGEPGDEPECAICGTNKYPCNPETHIQARYIGTMTCEQFYEHGLNGRIPSFMCVPLQNYAFSVCGCGECKPNPAPVSSPVSTPTNPGPP